MISIVIPARNEEKSLPRTLAAIAPQVAGHEVLLVDGGSQDRTIEAARAFPFVKVIASPAGRGLQMNTGAKQARGEWLLFLHADTRLPPDGLTSIERLPANVLAGGFHHRFDDPHPLLRLLSALHNFRAGLSRLFYGDQAVFVRREAFEKIGGYRESGVMEDVDLGAKLLKITRPVFLKQVVRVEARKFRAMGVWRGFFHVLGLFVAYNWFPSRVDGKEPFFNEYR